MKELRVEIGEYEIENREITQQQIRLEVKFWWSYFWYL